MSAFIIFQPKIALNGKSFVINSCKGANFELNFNTRRIKKGGIFDDYRKKISKWNQYLD